MGSSQIPRKDKAKLNTIADIVILNPDEVNCSPHARLFPASPMFAATLAVASTKKTAYRPAQYQRFSLKISCRALPDCCAKDMSFSPSTGKTQGIRFRMSPPTKPASKASGSERVCSSDGKPGVVSVAISGSSRDGNVTSAGF